MKLLENKIIVSVLLFIVFLGIIGSSLMIHRSHNDYIASTQTTKPSDFVQLLNNIFDALREERLESALYLAKATTKNPETLEATYVKTDRNLKILIEVAQNHEDFRRYVERLEGIKPMIEPTREAVRTSQASYLAIFYQMYHQKIALVLLDIMSEIATRQSDELKIYLEFYEKYLFIKEYVVVEDSVVSYILESSQNLSQREIEFWKTIVSKEKIPLLDTLPNSEAYMDISSLMSPSVFANITVSEREMIEYESRDGTYSVSVEGWHAQIKKKMIYFNQVLEILMRPISEFSKEPLLLAKMWIVGYGLVVLLLIGIGTKLLWVLAQKRNYNSIDEETLKEIESVFEKAEQKEISRLIDGGKTNQSYKYFLKTIKEVNASKDFFLASISHQIRTPLNGIVGFVQLLKDSKPTDEQKELIGVIEKSTEQLLGAVNDVLDLSKIQTNKMELEKIPFDLIEKVETAMESYAVKATEGKIDFQLFVDPKLPTSIEGDPAKLVQVIGNLVSNAIKFTPQNGEVSVSIKKIFEDSDNVHINFSVSDTGIGMSEDQRSKLFQTFTQQETGRGRKVPTGGLGLTIANKLVQLMDGVLEVESEVDEGSSFFFTLILPKAYNAAKRTVERLDGFTVGILNPHIGDQYYINENLEMYVRYTGASVVHLTDESLMEIKEKGTLPDILFVDHLYRQRGGEFEKFLVFSTKTIVISTGDQKRNLKRYGKRIDRILFKPINFTKTLKVLSNKTSNEMVGQKVRFERIKILVAEDNKINQKLMLNILHGFDIEANFVDNGQSAYEERKNFQYDMIMMDIEMPIMDGIEATQKIIAFERENMLGHVPIVALTANALPGDRTKYLGAGMDGYLAKPLQVSELLTLLGKYFGNRMVVEK